MSITTLVLLIVEDELPLLEAIIIKARGLGFEVVSTRSVSEAIEMLSNIPSIDAVWLDHFLPDQTGLDLVKFMRNDLKWKTTPIFLVTNVAESAIINQYMKEGIQGYYTKVLIGPQDALRDIKNRLTTFGQAAA